MNTVSQSCLIFGLIWAPVAGAGPAALDQQEEHTRSADKKFTVKLEAPHHKQYCKAGASIEYSQRDVIARVNMEINNDDCAASSGSYTMSVRLRNDEGEVINLDFDESWQRADDQPILLKREYPIGKDVDLIRVRARKMKCVCAEIDSEGENDHQDK